jgi:hypothetical protein
VGQGFDCKVKPDLIKRPTVSVGVEPALATAGSLRLHDRNKRKSLPFRNYSTNAWSIKVSASQPCMRVRGVFEQLDPTSSRRGFVIVVGPGKLGTGKLCSGNVDKIAAE